MRRSEQTTLRIDKHLELCEIIEMSEQNRVLLASQTIPVIKDVLDAIDDLSANAEPSVRASNQEQRNVCHEDKQGM